MWKKRPQPLTEFDPTKDDYNGRELDELADALLREDARQEMCRDCGSRGNPTGYVKQVPQEAVDGEGNVLVLDFPEYVCTKDECGNVWFQGEGIARGIGGENPILFEEHFQSRRRREIYTTIGTPDPSITQGIYNRTHPQGRKVNSEEQRKRNGASFFR
jgi:hypothetical protein